MHTPSCLPLLDPSSLRVWPKDLSPAGKTINDPWDAARIPLKRPPSNPLFNDDFARQDFREIRTQFLLFVSRNSWRLGRETL